MNNCKHCNSEKLVKAGFKDGVQKWRCKECGKYQGLVDNRIKYTEEERKAAICLYLEGNGFRRTARILSELFKKNFCYRTIMQWVKKEGQILESQKKTPKEAIKILEMDELYTYIKKIRKNKNMDGSE